jgi:hypothetical protein
MNIDDIKKALECCSNPSINPCKDCPYNKNGDFSYCNDKILKDTLNLITEQEKEIERLKDENKENCWKCIEAKRVTEEDYAKLQEEFANYQIASDKEMIAQVKQAKIDVLNRLKSLSIYDDNYLDGYVFIDDIDKLLEEYENDA